MKTIAILCLPTICLTLALLPRPTAGNAAAGPCPSPDDDAIRAISETWKDAYNEGNAAQVATLYSQDAYYLTQHFVTGVVHPRAMIQAYVQHGVDAHYRVDSIELLATYCSGDLAYAITRYRSTNQDQKAMGVNLVVLRKIAGHWLIVAHESAVPDPATAIQHLDPVQK